MAKNTRRTEDEDEVEKVAAEPLPGGSGGNTGIAPVNPADFETEQDKAKLDKSIGGPSAEEAAERNAKADKAAAKEKAK
jgi:hypothetical protein